MPSTREELERLTMKQLQKVFPNISNYNYCDKVKMTKPMFIDRLILMNATLNPQRPKNHKGTFVIPEVGFQSNTELMLSQLNNLRIEVDPVDTDYIFPPKINDEECQNWFSEARENLKSENFINRQVCAVCSRLFPSITDPKNTLESVAFNEINFAKILKSDNIFNFEEFPELNGYA